MKNYNWTTGYNIAKGEWENMLWPKPGEKTLVCPAIDGGHSWQAGTYSPRIKLFYRVAQEWCMYLTAQPKSGGTTISAGAESRVLQPFVQAFMSAFALGLIAITGSGYIAFLKRPGGPKRESVLQPRALGAAQPT